LLCEAASRGHLGIVKLLLKAGADINSPGFDNETPLLVAIRNNQAAVVKFLIANGGDFKGVKVRPRTTPQ
jgi:ankyrin repeat protein